MPYSRPSYSWLFGLLREVILSLPLILMMYMIVTQAGPWRWLAELQIALFNVVVTNYTFGACLALAACATWALHVLLTRLGWPAKPLVGRWLLWGISLPRWLGFALIVGSVLLGMGLYYYVPLKMIGERTSVSIEDIETGQRPEARWLVLRGKALVDNPVVWTERREEKHRAVCMVSELWNGRDPIAVVIYTFVPKRLPEVLRQPEVEGVAALTGVPEMERSSFEKMGLKIDPNALYVEVGKDPVESARFAGVFAAVGAAFVFAVVIFDRVRLVGRKPEKVLICSWKAGDRCFAHWQGDNCYYAATAERMQGNEIDVLFDDGQHACLRDDEITPADIASGTRIFGRWQQGTLYFPGTVTQRDGVQIHIRYDDGDQEWTTLSMIRIVY